MEYEKEIPLSDAEQLFEFCECIIEKTRVEYSYQGFLWEIDVFHGDNEGLVVAEIELELRGLKGNPNVMVLVGYHVSNIEHQYMGTLPNIQLLVHAQTSALKMEIENAKNS